MNAKDFLERLSGYDEDRLKDIEIQGWWIVDDLEDAMRSQNIPLDEFTREEKRQLLSSVMVDFGDRDSGVINEQIHASVAELHDMKREQASRATGDI